MKMKKSDEITSPASFLKKQSHIITNNVANPDYYHLTPTTRHDLEKQMHRSHFHSQANSTKLMEDTYFDQSDALDMYSEGKCKGNDEQNVGHKNDLLGETSKHNLQSFYQSEELSSEHQNSQTKSQKKFGLSNYNFSQKVIKRVSSNGGGLVDGKQFLIIDSRKQKQNNKYLTLSDAQELHQEIKKYQISIDKLKQEHQRLRSQKFKLSNESMQLVELRLEHQGLKRKIKQLQTQKEMHLTLDSQQDQNNKLSIPSSQTLNLNIPLNYSQNYMTTSCLQNSRRSDREEIGKRNIPTFRNHTPNEISEIKNVKMVNSPRVVTEQTKAPNYKILQNMKSPYFLKKN